MGLRADKQWIGHPVMVPARQAEGTPPVLMISSFSLRKPDAEFHQAWVFHH
jgi:hypothetical protein